MRGWGDEWYWVYDVKLKKKSIKLFKNFKNSPRVFFFFPGMNSLSNSPVEFLD